MGIKSKIAEGASQKTEVFGFGGHKIAFRLWGEAKPQQRPRTFYIGGKIVTHSPKDNQASYLNQIQELFLKDKWQIQLRGAIRLTATFYFKRPKNHTNAKGKPLKPWRKYPAVRPDYDNLIKGIQDALNDTILADDGAIVEAHIYKRYADDFKPCTDIELVVLNNHYCDEIGVRFE